MTMAENPTTASQRPHMQHNSNAGNQPQISSPSSASSSPAASAVAATANIKRQQSLASRNQQPMIGGSSAAFQQIKQTQSSLARLTRVHQMLQQQQQHHSQINQSSQQSKEGSQHQSTKGSSTFVDCLIRRFKDCFSEDFCTVPMFVVGNLSPGSDGTHLILPPCVSLGRQNISRFANPKNNLRHMNSIRESCKSIEELDLGGNKLSDLIEVYKIVQCTPNLKFLNLSENDLSKTSPVAMACCPSPSAYMQATTLSSSTSYTTSNSNISSNSITTSSHTQWQQQQNQRTCLAPINQNTRPSSTTSGNASMTTRRHSTLGQSQGSTSAISRPSGLSRANEARRLTAATAALAQSKKTSSSVASRLASSVAVAGSSSSATRRQMATSAHIAADPTRPSQGATKAENSYCARPRAGAASTLNLARSLSSLSAKDVRTSSLLPSRRMSARRTTQVARNEKTGSPNLTSSARSSAIVTSQSSGHLIMATGKAMAESPIPAEDISLQQQQEKQQSLSKIKSELFGGPIDSPIAETDTDVDMNEQTQQAPAAPVATTSRQSISGTNNDHHNTAPPSRVLLSQQQQHMVGGTRGSLVNHPMASSSSSSSSSNFRRTFWSIKALALNNTGCPWRVVCSILSRMPNLEELHLSLNNYERIDLDPNEFKHHKLKRLYLCNNPKLTSWQELDKLLSAFPSLEALSIADCNISQIPDNLDRALEWQKLCGLNINGWPIKEWPVVERLNQLPSLIDLKCRNLEVLQSIDEPRHHLIARLPKLQRLNGSEIEEREHAEKAFLRFFMANSHLERPTRFHELIQIHGEVTTTVDVDVDLSPPSQASIRVVHLNRNYYRNENQDEVLMSEDFLVKLMDNVEPYANSSQQHSSLENMDDCDNEQSSTGGGHTTSTPGQQPVRLFKDEGQEVVALDVDLRQSVRKFKSILANLFDLDQQNIILYYIDHEMVGLMGPELIKHNQKKLWNYNVQNGDQFIVEER